MSAGHSGRQGEETKALGRRTDARRVLIPRDRPDDPLAAAVAEAGLTPVPVTLTRTVPATAAELDRTLDALTGLASQDWFAVTSATTVEVLGDRADEHDTPLAELAGAARVAAVGPATRHALATAGLAVALRPPRRSSAEDLLAVWPPLSGTPGARVLWAGSARAADTLVTGLRQRGWPVTAHAVYDTVPLDPPPELGAELAAGGVDAVVLTSGMIARALAGLGPLHPRTRVLALGPVTARAAREAGLPVHTVAGEQTPAAVAAALAGPLLGMESP